MLAKSMRILVADPNAQQCLVIEKMLNALGCFCIATASSRDEALALLAYRFRLFDLVLINCALLRPGSNKDGAARSLKPHRFALAYSNDLLSALMGKADMQKLATTQLFNSGLPDAGVLQRVVHYAQQAEKPVHRLSGAHNANPVLASLSPFQGRVHSH